MGGIIMGKNLPINPWIRGGFSFLFFVMSLSCLSLSSHGADGFDEDEFSYGEEIDDEEENPYANLRSSSQGPGFYPSRERYANNDQSAPQAAKRYASFQEGIGPQRDRENPLPSSRRKLGGYEDLEFQKAVINGQNEFSMNSPVLPSSSAQPKPAPTINRDLEALDAMESLQAALSAGNRVMICGEKGPCDKCHLAKNINSICTAICRAEENFSKSKCVRKGYKRYRMDAQTFTYEPRPEKNQDALTFIDHLLKQLKQGRQRLTVEKQNLFNAFCSAESLSLVRDPEDKKMLEKGCLDYKYDGNPPPDLLAKEPESQPVEEPQEAPSSPEPVEQPTEPVAPTPKGKPTIIEDKEAPPPEEEQSSNQEDASNSGDLGMTDGQSMETSPKASQENPQEIESGEKDMTDSTQEADPAFEQGEGTKAHEESARDSNNPEKESSRKPTASSKRKEQGGYAGPSVEEDGFNAEEEKSGNNFQSTPQNGGEDPLF